MIKVAKKDQDVLRFLWFNDVHAEVQIFKFTHVVFGVSPSPYLLNATIVEHLKKFEKVYTSTTHKIKDSIYVDDVIMGASSVCEAFKLYQESKKIFREGGFNLRKL